MVSTIQLSKQPLGSHLAPKAADLQQRLAAVLPQLDALTELPTVSGMRSTVNIAGATSHHLSSVRADCLGFAAGPCRGWRVGCPPADCAALERL